MINIEMLYKRSNIFIISKTKIILKNKNKYNITNRRLYITEPKE
jgi:hypothetical protein